MEKHRSNDSSGFEVANTDEFREALGELLKEAHNNDIDVNGGWPVRPSGNDPPSWDVEITPLSKETTHQAPETGEFPIDAILEAVASRESVQKNELPPLQRSVDVDSIAQVYDDLSQDAPGEVTFVYCGYTVSVYADGRITVDG